MAYTGYSYAPGLTALGGAIDDIVKRADEQRTTDALLAYFDKTSTPISATSSSASTGLAPLGASSPAPGPRVASLPQGSGVRPLALTSSAGNIPPSDEDRGALIRQSAARLGVDPVDLGTAISYESAGSFSPSIRGGAGNRHIGLIQFGPTEQQTYGASQGQSFGDQMQSVESYLKDRGMKPGMGMLDLYSTINAGSPGRYGASDANNGGAPGTVKDKVEKQMDGHRAKAIALLGQGPVIVANNDDEVEKAELATGQRAGTPTQTADASAYFAKPTKLADAAPATPRQPAIASPDTAPVPSAKPSDYVIVGDSLGVGTQQASGVSGNVLVGRQPGATLNVIRTARPGTLPPNMVITGPSNDPENGVALTAQMVAEAKAKGTNPIVMGMGPKFASYNPQLQQAVEAAGGRFVPLPTGRGMVAPDGVHLTDSGYKQVWADIQAGGAPAGGAVPSAVGGVPGATGKVAGDTAAPNVLPKALAGDFAVPWKGKLWTRAQAEAAPDSDPNTPGTDDIEPLQEQIRRNYALTGKLPPGSTPAGAPGTVPGAIIAPSASPTVAPGEITASPTATALPQTAAGPSSDQTSQPAAGAAPRGLTPDKVQQIRTLIANPGTRQFGLTLWQQAQKPDELSLKQYGNEVWLTDSRGNILRRTPLPKDPSEASAFKPVTIKDANGRETTMFLDPSTNTLKRPEEIGFKSSPAEQPDMFDGKSVEGQALNHLVKTGQLTREQAANFGAGKTITGPDGSIQFLTPNGVFSYQNGTLQRGPAPSTTTPGAPVPSVPVPGAPPVGGTTIDGAPVPQGEQPRSGLIPLTGPREKEPPGEAKNAALYASRMLESNKILSQPEISSALMAPVDRLLSNIPGVGNYLVSSNYQQAEQAQRDFINALLRRESGAVISPEEFDSARKQYLPQPGNGPKVLQQKAANRDLVIRGLINAAGSAFKPAPVSPPAAQPAQPAGQPQQPAQPQARPVPPPVGSIKDGWQFIGGDPSSPSSWRRPAAPVQSGPVT